MCIPKIVDYGLAASMFWLRSVTMNAHILTLNDCASWLVIHVRIIVKNQFAGLLYNMTANVVQQPRECLYSVGLHV